MATSAPPECPETEESVAPPETQDRTARTAALDPRVCLALLAFWTALRAPKDRRDPKDPKETRANKDPTAPKETTVDSEDKAPWDPRAAPAAPARPAPPETLACPAPEA